ncbi:elongation factor Ts [Brevundimonas diminuta]|jgi:elongation factor Ts|uniref:Elongation factor Ts n=1 Tax=Brevundimonas diminuta TaxID=293 RepID=A0A410NY25_BREDI|nr:translation elongation factor Ts [Brevundimonas diminuta]MBD3572199.1 elongation factor Ts [Brevundimonas diminuta]QAT14733.1 elongation factor Ts [Brevundimonas diminuta]QQB87888.1 elongation factor Ts [Brevundimonas diminuta]GEC00680.1 elongation factor Ts [Brevundimonas diminuta]
MAEITAALVKELRERSGVGMMDCKKALVENNGDIEAAIDWLRAKGLSKAAKKADRVAAEGLVAVAVREDGKGEVASAIEFNAETDFVARNDLFQSAAKEFAQLGLHHDGVEAIHGATLENGKTVQDEVTNLIATIGENMQLRRAARLSVGEGVVSSYVHNAVSPGVGRIGVLVALEGAGDKEALREVGRKIAMHVAATAPLALDTSDLDPAAIEKERAVLIEKAKEEGRPENMIEKIVEGQINKFQKDVVLTKQPFVMDPDVTIEQLVANTGKELGSTLKLAGFVRMALGEGVEKVETPDFASEVASMTGGN